MRTFLLSLAVLGNMVVSAQITLETSVPVGHFYEVRSLADGTKYYSGNTLYNPDFTVYRTITYPPAPSGYSYLGTPTYITETLFDTDPSTIEVLLVMQSANPTATGVRVIREDGTVVFEDLTHNITGLNGMNEFSSASPIVQNSAGTFLLLADGPINPTLVYRLPGTLPCISCTGISTGGLAPQDPAPDPTGPEAMAFPNPTSGSVRFTCTIPAGLEHVTLQVTDASGRIVRMAPVQGTGTMELDLADQAAGNYLYHLIYGNGRTTAKQLLVIGTGR